jgi:SAM-dependent methyltransferase
MLGVNSLQISKFRMSYFRIKYRSSVYKSSIIRNYFEYSILPYFHNEQRFQRILFVGVARFTQHYLPYFNNKELIRTIDTDPDVASFSSPAIHIVDSIENIDQHVDSGTFDLVLMNGVYGWGLASEDALQNSINNIHKVMKPEGVLLFGWNEMDEYDPLKIRTRDYFDQFEPYPFNGKAEIKFPTPRNPKQHVYSFYKK